jgi:uncharacterized membrane protein YcaP (DUF421 family)
MSPDTGFDWSAWLGLAWQEAVMVLVSVAVLYLAVIGLTRIMGLRSFAKMSAFDFATTVAIGSLFGTAIATRDPSVAVALVAFSGLFVAQKAMALARQRIRGAEHLIDNEPILLMDGPEILHDNLHAANVTVDDLRAKLREANVLHRDQVRAVVLETTGKVSVLHSDDPDVRLEPELLDKVRGAERLRGPSDD